MKIIRPKKLQKGDTVGIVSFSGYIDKEQKNQFLKGVKFLESLDLKVKVGKNAFARYYSSAGTIQQRISDIHEMFKDTKVKAIFQSQGGETANEILDYLDWNLIKSNPKIFGGMSDGTTLILPIYAKTGMITLHGPDILWGYGKGISDYEKESLKKILFTGEVSKIKPNKFHKVSKESINSSPTWKSWRDGKANGKLIGGNLSAIERLHGTEYQPDYNNAILFLEGIGDNIETLTMKFTHLKHLGIFDKINGIILGYFYDNLAKDSEENNRMIGEVLTEVSKDYNFPILEIGEIGHNVANVNLPIGVNATIDSENLLFSIDEAPFR